MTSRDFRAIAGIIAGLNLNPNVAQGEQDRTREHIAQQFADYLATTNPAFDRVRFLDACTGSPARKGDKPRAADYAR